MESSQLKYRLASLISNYINHEIAIEKMRIELVYIPFFEPIFAFKLIDILDRGLISSKDIQGFLIEHNVSSIIGDCDLLIAFFDVDKDGYLSFSEFCSIILPTTITFQGIRNNGKFSNININENTKFEIENSLSKLINFEINGQVTIENDKKHLTNLFDFDAYKLFEMIDIYKINSLDLKSIKHFLDSIFIHKTDEEIMAFIRRADQNNDAQLSFMEFYDAMIPTKYYKLKFNADLNSPIENLKRRAYQNLPYLFYDKISPIKRSYSPSSLISTNLHDDTPEKITYVKEIPRKIYIPTHFYLDDSKYFSLKEQNDALYLISEINKLDSSLNYDIKNLEAHPDFDILDLFKIFDKKNRGYLIYDDLLQGFRSFNLEPSTKELVLFFKRCDLDNDQRISFYEFCEAFFVKSGIKDSSYIPYPKYSLPLSITGYFSPMTKNKVRSVLQKYLLNECTIDSLKRNVILKHNFVGKELFDLCDFDNEGFLSREGMSKSLKLRVNSRMNLELLFSRFDRNRDNIISLNEFTEAILPNKVISI